MTYSVEVKVIILSVGAAGVTKTEVVAVTRDTPELGDTPLTQSVLPDESTV